MAEDNGKETSRQRRRIILKKFTEDVHRKSAQKIRGREQQEDTVWFGLGMFGLVGWSVAIPTLLGVALGIWIDKTWPTQYSWTLMLLIGGLLLGCLSAWYWIKKGGYSE